MKRLFTILAALALIILCATLLPAEAQAATMVESGTCGTNLTWTLDDEGTLTISGTGAMTNYTSSYSVPWYSSSASVKTVVIEDGVTKIGNYAFCSCYNLTSIIIPNGVTSIGESAFEYCDGLISITIPKSVTSIGTYAFKDCSGLEEINFNATKMQDFNDSSNVFYCAGHDGDGIVLNIGANVTKIPAYFSDAYIDRGPDYFEPDDAWYAPNITTVNFADGSVCKSIGAYAFAICKNITDITLPNSLTNIGEAAFAGCSRMKGSIAVPDGMTSIGESTFGGCMSLTSITIPDSVTSIGHHAFSDCAGLSSITIPAGVTSIGDYAFTGCTGIKDITIPAGVTSIGEATFYNCFGLTSVTIPDSVTSIGMNAFRFCAGLTSIDIPDSVTYISRYAFSGCTNLTSVTIPAGVTSIGDSTFGGCMSLASVTIPGSATNIGEDAFRDCTSLTSITIPASVTHIAENAFEGCSGLVGIWVNEKNTVYSSDTNGALFDKDKTVLIQMPEGFPGTYTVPDGVTSISAHAFDYCVSLTRVIISDSVASIGNRAFSGCTSLTSITIPDSVTSIGSFAFLDCTSLIDVTIPDSVTSIYAVFWGCTSLTSITIPDGMTSIDYYAFYNCTNLTSISIPYSVKSIGDYAFSGCTSLTDVIYCGTAAYWDYVIEIGTYNKSLTNANRSYHSYVDGKCEFCGATDPDAPTGPVQVDELNFKKIAFNLSGYIGLQFAISNNAAANYDEVYVKVVMDIYTDGVAEEKVYELREGQTAGSYLVFIHGVAPKLMGRVMNVQTIAVKDGVEYCGAAQEYSIKQGIIDRLNADKGSTTEKAINRSILMVDMLYYGAEAQKRFSQDQYDGLVTEDPNVAEFLSLRTAEPQAVTATNTAAPKTENELYGYNLGLSEAVELQLTFTLTAGEHEAYTIQITCAGEVYTYGYESFQYAYSNYPNRATVVCGDLAAKQMRDEVTIVLLKNGKQVSKTYVARIEGVVQPTVANATHKNNALLKAMMAYGDSAKVYFG